MGSDARAVRFAGRIHHEPAPFLPTTHQSILVASGLLSEPRRLFAQSRHADDALCLFAIFPRRQAALDRRAGAAGPGARRENEILAGQRGVAFRYPRLDLALL